MPIYEFECPVHGRFERIVPLSLFNVAKDGSVCKIRTGCYEKCEKVWSIPANIQIAPATKVFINSSTGESFVASTIYDKAPVGYVERELKGPIERSKFENEENAKVHIQDEIDTFRMDARRSAHQKERHDGLKAKMNALQTETYEHDDGRVEEVKHFLEPKTKHMIKEAMERSNKRRVPKKETIRKLAINHQNSSNLIDTIIK